jgi:hypothetical protein
MLDAAIRTALMPGAPAVLRNLTGGGMGRIAGHFRRFTGCMHIKLGGAHCSENRFGAINFRCGAVSHQ